MLILLIIILLLPLYLIKILKWTALVQQKEYRLDRLNIYLQTKQGQQDWLLPVTQKIKFNNLSWLKRPHWTSRIITVFCINLILHLGSIILVLKLEDLLIQIILLFIIYLIQPLITLIAVLPSSIIFKLITWYQLITASQKIKKVKPILIGITGSYGKTSTKYILAHVLSQKYSTFFTPKSYNQKFSLARSINRLYKNQKIAVIEYAAYKMGEIRKYTNYFKPQIAIVTGFAPQHLGLFGSKENIIKAKSELVQAVPKDQPIFCNGKDLGAIKICEKHEKKNIFYFNGADTNIKVHLTKLNQNGQLHFTWKKHHIQTQLYGKHYIDSIKATILVAKHLKLNDQQIVKGLSTFQPPDFFIQLYKTYNNALVIDDGRTSNPAGFKAAIQLIKHFQRSNNYKSTIITSGIVDLGSESKSIHKKLANKVNKTFDKVIHTSQTGLQEFENNLSPQKLLTKKKNIIKYIECLDENHLILIQGWTPVWLLKKLKLKKIEK